MWSGPLVWSLLSCLMSEMPYSHPCCHPGCLGSPVCGFSSFSRLALLLMKLSQFQVQQEGKPLGISTFKSIFSRFADILLAKAVHMAKPVITEGGNNAKVWFQGGRFCSLPLHFTAGGCMYNLFHSLNNLIHFSE